MRRISQILAITIWFSLTGFASSAEATTLLSLINPPVETVSYSLDFVATIAETTLSVGGYQVPSFEQASYNVVSLTDGGPNLLGSTWNYIPAARGRLADPYSDGTDVNALDFGGVAIGYYDVFYQSFATTIGDSYTYAFSFTEDYTGASAFEVSVGSAALVPSVPEPSTWSMLLAGFMGLGYVAYRRARKISPPLAVACV